MKKRILGGLEVSALGLGRMAMNEFYGPSEYAESEGRGDPMSTPLGGAPSL